MFNVPVNMTNTMEIFNESDKFIFTTVVYPPLNRHLNSKSSEQVRKWLKASQSVNGVELLKMMI